MRREEKKKSWLFHFSLTLMRSSPRSEQVSPDLEESSSFSPGLQGHAGGGEGRLLQLLVRLLSQGEEEVGKAAPVRGGRRPSLLSPPPPVLLPVRLLPVPPPPVGVPLAPQEEGAEHLPVAHEEPPPALLDHPPQSAALREALQEVRKEKVTTLTFNLTSRPLPPATHQLGGVSSHVV